MSGKVILVSMIIGFMASVIVHHPPGYRCQYQKECVPIRLF